MADKMQGLLELGQVSPRLLPRFLPLSLFSRVQVYFVSRGRLKPANKKFSSVKNDYELTLGDETSIELVGVVITSS